MPLSGLDLGGGGVPPNPESQLENEAKFLRLKGKGGTILNVNSSGHKEPQNCNFSTTSCLLMPIVMIVSQFHVMSKVPKPAGCGLESECGTENFLRTDTRILCTPPPPPPCQILLDYGYLLSVLAGGTSCYH